MSHWLTTILIFLPMAGALAVWLLPLSRQAVGSLGEITQGFRFGSGEVAKAQNGLVRLYALVLASGVAVLAVVFIATR